MRLFQTTEKTAIGALDPRSRVAAALALSLLIVLLNRWTAIGVGVALSLAALTAARAFNRFTVRRLAELTVFSLFLLVFMPLSIPGTPWLRLGSLQWSGEGVLFALRIGAKAGAVMMLCGALMAAMEPSDLAHALYRLKLPAKLAQTLFFCVRYLEVLHVEYHRLRNAMKLRAFRPACGRHALRSFGYLVGMLFVRSIDRSDRILEAMKCRGFEGHLYSLAEFAPGRRDVVFGVWVVVLACGIGFLEWGL